MIDLGLVIPGSTIRIPFSSFDSNDPSQSVAPTGFVVGDVVVYKDGSATQRTSTSGFTATTSFDTIVGANLIIIDLADNADAGFFSAGSEYLVAINTISIDGATIQFFAARLRIGYPGALLDTTIATRASTTSFTLTAGSANDDAYNGCVLYTHDVASAIQVAIGFVKDYVGSTKEVILAENPGIFISAVTDNISILPPSNVYAIAETRLTESSTGRIAGNFETFYDNGDAATIKVVDDVGSTLIPAARWLWSTATSGDPASGRIRGDNATIASITELSIHQESADDKNAGVIIGALRSGDNIAVYFTANPDVFLIFDVTATPIKTGAVWAVTGTVSDSNGTFVNTSVGVGYLITGNTETAAAIWDEILTGATHNVVNSAGRRLRQLQETGGYGGFIWLDTVNGTAGTVDFENGTDTNPVAGIADANTLSASVGIPRFRVAPGSSVTFVATQDNENWIGEGWTLALGGQSIAGITIFGADVSGIGTGAVHEVLHCHLGACTFAGGEFRNCGFEDTFTISAAAVYRITDCYHSEMGAPSTIDFDAAVGASEVHVHNWHGNLTILNMKVGDILHFTSPDGTLTLDSTCTAGTANLAGTFGFINNSTGMTINDNGQILTKVPTALIGGRMNSDVEAINNTTASAIRLALSTGQIIPATVDITGFTPTTTEFECDDITEATADHFNGGVVIFTSGALAAQKKDITDYSLVGGRGHFTVTALTEPPADDVTLIII